MLTQKMKQPFKTAQPVLFPPLADRAAWESLPGAARWAAAGQAALEHARTAPELPLSLWLQFTRSGDRAKWEHAYFARRRTLCALAMAEAVTNRGTYLPALADLAWRICEESAWQLPAHNSYIRDTPQLPLPDVTRPIVDLFAAETGALIATVCGLLGEALDAYAPGLAARLRGEVERRVLTPYRTAHFWWMGNGDEPMCNWTPWCTQNVLLAAAQCAPAEDLPAYVQQAAYSIDCFLKDYGDDGCCSEGAQYYRHAALTMFNALDLLCKMAPGVFDDVWAEPKIRNMAEYIVNMHIAGPYYLNFADCSPLAGARGVREYLFGKRVGSLPLMTLAARDWPPYWPRTPTRTVCTTPTTARASTCSTTSRPQWPSARSPTLPKPPPPPLRTMSGIPASAFSSAAAVPMHWAARPAATPTATTTTMWAA